MNTGRRLTIRVIDIFEKFFLHGAEDALLSQLEADERDLLKKFNHFAKLTFCSKADLLPHVWDAHRRAVGPSSNPRPLLKWARRDLSNGTT